MKNQSKTVKTRAGIAGFTLVEMMITLLISAIVMGAVYAAYQAQQKSMTNQQAVVAMQQDLRAATILMERDLREAGVDPFDPAAGAGIIAATSTMVRFTRDIAGDLINPNEADGILDDPNENITFMLQNDTIPAGGDGIADGGVANWDVNANGTLGRRSTVGGVGGFQTIASNIDALEFNYILDDGTRTLTPTATELNQIRAIQISILARADRLDPKFANNLLYATGSGPPLPLPPWQAPGDGFRRRLSVVTVFCRNLEL